MSFLEFSHLFFSNRMDETKILDCFLQFVFDPVGHIPAVNDCLFINHNIDSTTISTMAMFTNIPKMCRKWNQKKKSLFLNL